MIEGWYGNDYLILFDETESEQLTEGYGVRQYLPELTVVGILGWDDSKPFPSYESTSMSSNRFRTLRG
jgi:hypothetical protein